MNENTIKAMLCRPSPVEKYIRQAWLGECLQVTASYFISHHDESINDTVRQRYLDGLKKLEHGVPLAYVMGKQGFWKHDFVVNEHTLIPRPDTEILVDTVLQLSKNSLSKNTQNSPISVLDLGTGSGCIAISLAAEYPAWQITAIDYSQQALRVAEMNKQQIGVNNVTLLQGDWYTPLVDTTNSEPQDSIKFDIIVSNPPYIDPQDPHLSLLTDEPITALTAQNHGMADIEHIIANANHHLKNDGLLAIEHGFDQAEQVRALFTAFDFTEINTVKDFGGNDRVTYGFLKNSLSV